MGQLTRLTLENGTDIYIEATENTATSGIITKDSDSGETTRGLLTDEVPKQAAQSFKAIENTIRAYATSTLNAFKDLAIAEVSEVTLEFGINIDMQTGLPYIANGKTSCNAQITVRCAFPPKVK